MAWTTPRTWVDDEIVEAVDLNAHLRDNMNYVHSGKPASAITLTSGDISLGTSFADLDATNLSFTLSITTGRVLIAVIAMAETASTNHLVALDVTIDGTRQGGTDGLSAALCSINVPTPLSFSYFKTGLSVGSHTFRLQGLHANVSTAVIRAAADSPLHFAAMEV